MSTERDYTKAKDGKRILLTEAKITLEDTPKTLTVGVEAGGSYTILIPKNHSAKASKVVGELYLRPDIYLQAIERDICDRAEGPYNPVIVLLTVILVIGIVGYSVSGISDMLVGALELKVLEEKPGTFRFASNVTRLTVQKNLGRVQHPALFMIKHHIEAR